MQVIEGSATGEDRRFCLIVARFNHFVTERLLEGASAALQEHGVAPSDITVVRVPGTFELPPVAMRMAKSGRFDALIALGAVIRGGTPHFEYVAGEAATGTAAAAMQSGVPVAFGILTTDDMDKALERAGDGPANKGWEAALAALEMADLHSRLRAAGF